MKSQCTCFLRRAGKDVGQFSFMKDAVSCAKKSIFQLVLPWPKRMHPSLRWKWGNRSWLLQEVTFQQTSCPRSNGSLRGYSVTVHLETEAGHLPSMIANWFLTRSMNHNHLESIFQMYLSEPHFQICSLQTEWVFFEKALQLVLTGTVYQESNMKFMLELFSFLSRLKFPGSKFWPISYCLGQTESPNHGTLFLPPLEETKPRAQCCPTQWHEHDSAKIQVTGLFSVWSVLWMGREVQKLRPILFLLPPAMSWPGGNVY